MEPTDTFEDKLEITEAGFDLVLYHAPGETNDQIIVHWPEKDAVFPADNLYRAFPNLYAIRGTTSRYTLSSNMTMPDFKHFLVFITRYFFPSKRPSLKDFCVFFEMEEYGASEVTNYM